ncbi:MAG: hypothetical protein K6G55_01965 [Selenomonadaceae bacterium]|nr:hypothetical protein [Selenomonadaceae bacterium]
MKKNLKLTEDEIKILESNYGRQFYDLKGYNPNKLDDILDLTTNEKNFFEYKNFLSPHFFLQTLYKIRGDLNPLKFNLAVNRMLNENQNLRVNFCDVGTRTLKVVRPVGSVKPEIIFRNLTLLPKEDLDDNFRKIMLADMRRDADLKRESLMRFAVYRTSSNEFALLLTIAQVIADAFDAEKFFADVLGIEVEPKSDFSIGDVFYAKKDVAAEYWAKILKSAPSPATLPFGRESLGVYSQKSYYMNVPMDILSDLRNFSQSNRVMLMAFLQTAWGFMLQLFNKRSDIMFCQIINDNRSDNTSFSLIPVCLSGHTDLTVEKVVRKQFMNLVTSQPYTSVDWSALDKLIGHDKKNFDHFLSFREFQSNELKYNETPADEHGKVIFRNSWDAQGMNLGIYFRYSEKFLSLTFLYNEHQFATESIEKICAIYEIVLKQMILEWNAKYPDFFALLKQRVDYLEVESKPEEDIHKKIRDFLSQLHVLQGRTSGTIKLFENTAELLTYYAGDRLSGDLLKEKFFFVVDGQLSRNIDDGSGWYNPIDIVKKNAFVNPTYLLKKQKLVLSAGVLTESAQLLAIPHDVLVNAIRKNSEVSMSVLSYALSEMERWQLLWLQS